tara:strand:- start:740 stop:988 length:249 start_codon:yes stop_codon:yes gene_type:complete
MRPSISFDDIAIIPVEKESSKYNSKTKKHVDLKKPIIKKGKKIEIGDCFDLFDLVKKLDYHIEDIPSYDGYLEVNFKLKAYY